MNRLLVIMLCIFSAYGAKSQNLHISGQVKDAETGEAIGYADVVLRTTDSALVAGTTTDPAGRFRLTRIPAGDYILTISMIGYTSNVIEFFNFSAPADLEVITLIPGNITLDEVTVTAHNITALSDRKLIFPSEHQRKTNTNGLSLLQNLMLPRITVNPMTKEISVTDEGGVQIRINGVRASATDAAALLPDDIVRIEFIDNPGVRYGDAAVVINYITNQHNTGGSIGCYLANSPQIHFGENSVFGRFNRKNSEFSASYRLSSRTLKKMGLHNHEELVFEDGTRITRSEDSQSGEFKRWTHTGKINYSYRPSEHTLFNAGLNYFGELVPYENYYNILTDSQYPGKELITGDLNDRTIHNPSLDLYYIKKLEKNNSLIFNVVGTYYGSRIYRIFSEEETGTGTAPGDPAVSDIHGHKYSVIGEGIYEKRFSKGRFTAGIRHMQSVTNNRYGGTYNTKTKQQQADSYLYAEYQGNWKKLNYTFGLGVSRLWSEQKNEDETTQYLFRPRLSLHYQFNDNAFLRLNARIQNMQPGLSELSDVMQPLDFYQIRRGNPYLKPYVRYRADLIIEKRISSFSLTGSTYYILDKDPVMASVLRENGKFIHTYDNQRSWQQVNSELTLRSGLLWKILQFSMTGGVNHNRSKGNDYVHNYTAWYMRGTLSADYKNFRLSGQFTTHSKRLRGETIYLGEDFSAVTLNYRIKNFILGAGMLNPHGTLTFGSKNLNQYTYKENTTFERSIAGKIILSLEWNIEFGRKFKSIQKKVNNRDADSGVMDTKRF